jgi:hypothetical protein
MGTLGQQEARTMNQINGMAPAIETTGTTERRVAAPPAPQAPTALKADSHQAASVSRSPIVATLSAGGPPEGFTKLMRGFAVGQSLEVSAKGFFGSGLVGGHGSVKTISADVLHLDVHVRAPGNNSDEPMSFRRDGDTFIASTGIRWQGSFSADGKSFELTKPSNGKNQRILFAVDQPGTLKVTTWGFGGDGKPLTIAVKR